MMSSLFIIQSWLIFNFMDYQLKTQILFQFPIQRNAIQAFQSLKRAQCNVLVETNNKSGTHNYFPFLCFFFFFDHNLLHLLSRPELQIHVQMFHNIIYISFSLPCYCKDTFEGELQD